MSLGAADTSVCATSWLRSISPTVRNPRPTSGVLILFRQRAWISEDGRAGEHRLPHHVLPTAPTRVKRIPTASKYKPAGAPEFRGYIACPRNTVYARNRAAGFAKYVKIMLAPARVIDVNVSIMARSSSIQPLRAAATIMEYSPLTW